MANDWRDNLAEFFGQGADDSVRSGRRNGPGMSSPKAGIWDAIWGRDQSELDEAARTFRQDTNRENFKGRIEALGGTYNPDQTAGQHQQQILELQDRRTDERFPNTPAGRAFQQQKDQLALDNTRIEKAAEVANNQTAFQNNALIAQMQDNQSSRSFDREQSEANRLLTLQLANINSDLQDKRLAYDRETRRMDRRDRHIATLMSGLGQLGGAFSL